MSKLRQTDAALRRAPSAPPLSTGSLAFPESFSDCSVKQLADFMARARPSCLSRPPGSVETIAVAPLCGNHLLDGGEECDCGTVEVRESIFSR